MQIKKLNRRDFLKLGGLTAGSSLLASCRMPFGIGDDRPNFLIILTDDQRYDTMQYMPKTQELIFDRGVTFSRGYVSSPLCGPSRANILTGAHVHQHGVRDNKGELQIGTFVEDLHDGGYYTGLVGKFLNKWKGEMRPEYDYWASLFKDDSRYHDLDYNVNGEWQWQKPGYVTDVTRDFVLAFVDRASAQLKPFFLLFGMTAPHGPAIPAAEDADKYPDLPPNRPPNFNEPDMSDKPDSVNWRPLFNEEEIERIEEFRRDQILTLLSADRAIQAIVEKLEEKGELENTVLIFLSDNGKHWGEHRLESKGTAYEESVRVPFGLRYPPLVPEPYVEDRLVGSVDIAPTLYDLARLPIPEHLEGESLVPMLAGEAWTREEIFIECWPSRGHWELLHRGRYKYVETDGDENLSEFYDLEEDPYELQNQIKNPDYADLIAEMKTALEEKRGNY